MFLRKIGAKTEKCKDYESNHEEPVALLESSWRENQTHQVTTNMPSFHGVQEIQGHSILSNRKEGKTVMVVQAHFPYLLFLFIT